MIFGSFVNSFLNIPFYTIIKLSEKFFGHYMTASLLDRSADFNIKPNRLHHPQIYMHCVDGFSMNEFTF